MNRVRIAFFGKRNAGKSSLVNAVTNQRVSIVSDVPGTTTDPVTKTMEILPIGPVAVIDTAGLDDVGELGELRVKRSYRILENADIAVLVVEAGNIPDETESELLRETARRKVPTIIVGAKTDLGGDPTATEAAAKELGVHYISLSALTGEGVNDFRELLGKVAEGIGEARPIGDMLQPGDTVVLVVPIDSAAPKGRLILPQVMVLRDVLDADASACVCKPSELAGVLENLKSKPRLVVTDSQAFGEVAEIVPDDVPLTGFSLLMARMKGDLAGFIEGVKALKSLKPGAKILISEGCTHHRQCDDIGTVKIPRVLRKMCENPEFVFSSGNDFPDDVSDFDLIVHCGGCMLNRREVLYRQRKAAEAGVPMTNYGMVLALATGIFHRASKPFETLTESDK